ncbi:MULTISPECIES: RNA polymerase sigma factor [Micrococcaceae]|uniref:RNA polymerase sigma factor n=1 Tax=Micrococcaceae TaxID=1268 RepID=UPI001CFFE59B|nr:MULTISPECIES: RNA polymerase sigma factor [Micrococcaceae]MCB5283411.1 ECF RNA polymerase sigma factor SigL [Arthrobacter sp. ES1]MDD1478100.1 RNA polymerase sigma factor [Arthrobacter sp. H16F315]MDJ0353389.1 RNA polymerase sigma factor [Pseudarthrobacter sp. PH31-O2]WGZ80512.1 RNA polymerase sigma factor [Arthrobacter sp. EM1]
MLLERETEFEALYRAHYRRVYQYVLRRIGDPETAQELTGDVFRIAWRKFAAQEDAGLPWLCAVARNVLGNEYRGRKRRRELLLKLKDFSSRRPEPGGTGSGGFGETGEPTSEPVIAALGRIAARHREVLILVYWDNFTTAELAQCLGCSEGAASVRVHRAKKAFAATLSPHLDESAGT